ncbi:MAG: hypothetical protein HQL75_02820 [Magnetococcales bacterium]|nr:hypothetical protein [Magnetococcales bacterium]
MAHSLMTISTAQTVEEIIERALFNEMISAQQLHDVMAGNPQRLMLLDIRCREEYREGIIPGSVLFPNDHNLEDRSDTSVFRRCFNLLFKPEKFNPLMRFVLVCRSGPRTEIAMEIFLEHGFSACELIGGIMEWSRQGFSLEPAEGAPVLS